MYIVLRFLSIVFIVMSLMFLGADLITSLEKGGVPTSRSIEQVWMLFSKSSETAFVAWQHSLPAVISKFIDNVLSLWAWSVPGVLGVVLAILFGRRTADVS